MGAIILSERHHVMLQLGKLELHLRLFFSKIAKLVQLCFDFRHAERNNARVIVLATTKARNFSNLGL